MEEYLHISPGAVSVMGLMNDKEHHVKLLIDASLLEEEYLGVPPLREYQQHPAEDGRRD